MIKETPSVGRIAAMILFTFSCVGILLFLWLSFGGAIPLKPQSYRFSAKIAEAPTLAEEADVRMAGVNIGKVKTKELDKGGARTIVEMEVNPDFAPVAKDSKVILRQKTLLGESYIEVAPGHRRLNGPADNMLEDGGTLPVSQVEDTVELDEIFSAFDSDTRARVQDLDQGAGRRDQGRALAGPQLGLRQPGAVRHRRRRPAQGARRAAGRRCAAS